MIRWIKLITLGVIVGFILHVTGGCAKQIHPVTNVATHASYDPTDTTRPTSGVLGIAPNGGRIVSRHFCDRYNVLVGLYGNQFAPPLKKDNTCECHAECYIDKAHYIQFLQMNQWRRNGRPVVKKGWFW